MTVLHFRWWKHVIKLFLPRIGLVFLPCHSQFNFTTVLSIVMTEDQHQVVNRPKKIRGTRKFEYVKIIEVMTRLYYYTLSNNCVTLHLVLLQSSKSCVNEIITKSYLIQLLKTQSVILVKGCRCLRSTANHIIHFPSVFLKQCVDWLELCMAWSVSLCLFPVYRARTVYVHQRLFESKHRVDSYRIRGSISVHL